MALALSATPHATQAQEPGFRKSYSTCMDQSGGVTSEMQECISAEFIHQDWRLNTAYQSALRKFSQQRRNQLRDVQRKWLAYRDAYCALHVEPGGGSLSQLTENSCVLDKTAQRAGELEALLGS